MAAKQKILLNISLENFKMAEYVEYINFENPNLYWEFGDEEELDDEFEDLVAEDIKEESK